MLRNLAISTLLCAGVVSVAYADVFRWVDDHGGVHYSDQWVPGSESIKTSNKPHPDSATSAPSSKLYTSPPSQDNAAKAVKQDMAKVREQQCKEAKDRYEKAIQARRIYKTSNTPAASGAGASKDADRPDDRQYLSEEEADAYRVKARQEVQDFCGAAATKPSGE